MLVDVQHWPMDEAAMAMSNALQTIAEAEVIIEKYERQCMCGHGSRVHTQRGSCTSCSIEHERRPRGYPLCSGFRSRADGR